MSSRSMTGGPTLALLEVAESWRLLGGHCVGRICFSVDDRIRVLPTTYVTHQDLVYFRAAAFGKLAHQVLARPVTLEVDDQQDGRAATWVVTVTGHARHVEDAATLASLWTPVRPTAWETGQRSLWVALTPDDVQGRRIQA